MKIEDIRELVSQIEQNYRSEFQGVSDFIFNHPEIGGKEFVSSKYLSEYMENHDFEVTFPYEDLETAFIAEYGDDEGPTIAFLAEYDALPGYETESGNGHACAHNWIASTMCGISVILSKLKSVYKGKILLIGTPAEETFGAKVNLIKKGAFDDVDIVFQAHLENDTVIDTSALAMGSIQFEFSGKASHAASYPEDGINALDAVQLTFMGINSLRQHLKPDARVHGIITQGGVAANIVPDKGICQISMRSANKKYLTHVISRVTDCAKGAALITGTKLEYWHYENSFDDLLNIPTLMNMTKRNLIDVGVDNFLDKNQAPPPGSTDIGNVSYVCPTLYVEVALDADQPFKVHEAEALKYANSHFAYKKMTQVINALTITAIELFMNPEKVQRIKTEHREIIKK